MALYIGLMSGTSLDGIDGVVVDFGPADAGPARVLRHAHRPFDAALRAELLALNQPGDNELHRAALAANALARECAALVAQLEPAGVRAVGAHGQTVRHRPGEFDGQGYTLQLLNGALLAELCGIDVVCDLRSRDVAAGGQGAPLVPAFHQAMFAEPGRAVAVLNLGGIANLTLLGAQGELRGFDCGPGNALLDGWCLRHQGRSYDEDGRWAASGQVDGGLLAALLAQPYFQRPPPKSTGRDLFHLDGLDADLQAQRRPIAPVDVQATLLEFTARAVADDLGRYASDTQALLVCGGGARNGCLMRRLTTLLPALTVQTTEARGLDVMQVEAAAFAWLAQRFVERAPGNSVTVTGAAGPRVLGALYPAG